MQDKRESERVTTPDFAETRRLSCYLCCTELVAVRRVGELIVGICIGHVHVVERVDCN